MKYKVLGSTGYAVDCPKVISMDTEYSQKQVRGAKLLSISIGVSPELTYILDDFSQVQRFIDNADIIYTWNGTVDQYILTQNGFDFPKEKILDAMLMEHLIDERLSHGLGDFAMREFGDNYKNEFWGAYSSYEEAPKDIAYEYEKKDGCYTFTAGKMYSANLGSKMELVRHVHRLQWALFDTEIKGLKVDTDLMIRTKQEMSTKINTYLPKLREEFNDYCNFWELKKWKEEVEKRKSIAGKQSVGRPVFSFTSDKQLQTLLYSKSYLGLPVKQKTKKGNPSTSYEALQEISQEYPEISTIVEYKDVKAVYSTFVEGMLERVQNGRIYPGFYINGTTTGRISHNNPNMGNLPRDGVIRNFFIPDDGHSIVGADYSQLEVVVEANLTDDPALLKIILEGASKHDLTAQGLGCSRDMAKTVNFALQYGAGVSKLGKILGVPKREAEHAFEQYWRIYHGVKTLKDHTAKILEETGQVTNLIGRTRHFGKPNNEYEKARFERQAYNHLIQGVGADITNRATYLVQDYMQSKEYGRLLFSVHDELVVESKIGLEDTVKPAIVNLMEGVTDYVNFKYKLSSKSYGPLKCWAKT